MATATHHPTRHVPLSHVSVAKVSTLLAVATLVLLIDAMGRVPGDSDYHMIRAIQRVDVPLIPGRGRIFRYATLTAVALLVADLVTEVVDLLWHPGYLLWEPVKRILDLNAESSLGTWFSVIGLAAIALACALIAIAVSGGDGAWRRHGWGLAGIALALSIDEQAQIHDAGIGHELRNRLPLHGVIYNGWVVFGLLTIVGLAALYWRFVFALPAADRFRLGLAAAVYVCGELGTEMIDGWWADRMGRDNLTYAVLTSVEEFLGMMGIVIGLWALVCYLERELGDVRFHVRPPRDGGELAAPSSPRPREDRHDRAPAPSRATRA